MAKETMDRIRAAEQEADEMVRQASEDARKLVQQAKQRASALRDAAGQEAQKLLSDKKEKAALEGQTELETALKKAEGDCAALALTARQREAEAVRQVLMYLML